MTNPKNVFFERVSRSSAGVFQMNSQWILWLWKEKSLKRGAELSAGYGTNRTAEYWVITVLRVTKGETSPGQYIQLGPGIEPKSTNRVLRNVHVIRYKIIIRMLFLLSASASQWARSMLVVPSNGAGDWLLVMPTRAWCNLFVQDRNHSRVGLTRFCNWRIVSD